MRCRCRKWLKYKNTGKTCDFVEYKKARNAAIARLRNAHLFTKENKQMPEVTRRFSLC